MVGSHAQNRLAREIEPVPDHLRGDKHDHVIHADADVSLARLLNVRVSFRGEGGAAAGVVVHFVATLTAMIPPVLCYAACLGAHAPTPITLWSSLGILVGSTLIAYVAVQRTRQRSATTGPATTPGARSAHVPAGRPTPVANRKKRRH